MSRSSTLFEENIVEETNGAKSGPNGFKRVKQVGWMPEEWQVQEIGKFGEIVTGTTPKTSNPEFYDGSYPFVSPGDMGEKMYLRDTEKTLTEKGFNEARPIPAGSVLFVCIGSSIGKVAITTEPVATNQQINAVVPSENYESEYIYYMLDYHSERIHVLAGVQAVPSINKSTFKSEYLPVPPLKERQEIIKRLSTWDRAIEQVDALIEQKRERLHGLRQRLLTGEVRFPEFDEPWREVRLDDVTRELRDRNEGQYGIDHVYGIKNDEGLTSDTDRDASSDLSKYKVIPQDAFAYNPMRLDVGSIGRLVDEGPALVSKDYIAFECDRDHLEPAYLDHYRETHRWEHFVETAGSGSVRVRIYYRHLKRMELNLPPLPEQRKIAETLEAAKTEINLLKEKRDALQYQKKGLMQRLLTGAVRTV